jgi:hypothetical protein
MKPVIFLLLIFIDLQPVQAQGIAFVRVYSHSGKKIGKGYIFKTTDSSIMLAKTTRSFMNKEILVNDIGVIKSKHTVAGRISVTSLKVVGYAMVVGIVIVAIAASTRRDGRHYIDPDNLPKREAPGAAPNQYDHPKKQYVVNGSRSNWRVLLPQLDRLW